MPKRKATTKLVFPRIRIPMRSRWVWVERDLETEGKEWQVAYRLVPQAGQILIGEVRVYPKEPKGDPGEWAGERATDVIVPQGGLSARMIRSVPMGIDHVMIRAMVKAYIGQGHLLGHFLKQRGFDTLPAETPRGRGGKALDPGHYAELAARYDDLCKESRSPVKDLADETGIDPKTVRHRLHIARAKLKFLGSTKQGSRGGGLTQAGRKALSEFKRATKPRRKKRAKKGRKK